MSHLELGILAKWLWPGHAPTLSLVAAHHESLEKPLQGDSKHEPNLQRVLLSQREIAFVSRQIRNRILSMPRLILVWIERNAVDGYSPGSMCLILKEENLTRTWISIHRQRNPKGAKVNTAHSGSLHVMLACDQSTVSALEQGAGGRCNLWRTSI